MTNHSPESDIPVNCDTSLSGGRAQTHSLLPKQHSKWHCFLNSQIAALFHKFQCLYSILVRAVITTGCGWGVPGFRWALIGLVSATTQGPLSALLSVLACLPCPPRCTPWSQSSWVYSGPRPSASQSNWASQFHSSPSDTISDPSRCQTQLIIPRPYSEEKTEASSHLNISRNPPSEIPAEVYMKN